MKNYLNISLIYAIFAMAGGIFYREFTKWNEFSGITMLGKVHTHLFLLGMIMFMIIALFAQNNALHTQKLFPAFLYIYNIGVSLTAIMMVIHGTLQVLSTDLSPKSDAIISGVAGIGHILIGTGIIFLLISLKNSVKTEG